MTHQKHHGLKNYRYADEFGKTLGYRIDRVDTKKHIAHVSLKVGKKHLSPAGRVHGGVVSALFDFACGAAVFSTMQSEDFTSTVELKVNYFRPIEKGDALKARAEVVFRGKRLCVVHAYLYKKTLKEPLAMATATFNVVSRSVV